MSEFGHFALHKQYVYANTTTEPTVKWFLPPNLYDDRPTFLRALKRRRIAFPEALADLNRLLHTTDYRNRIRDITVARIRSEVVDPNAVECLRSYYKFNKHQVFERCLPNTLEHSDYVQQIIACYSKAGTSRFVWVMQLQQTIPGFVNAVHQKKLEPENMALALSIARRGYVNFERIVGIVLGRRAAYGQKFEIAFIYSYTKPEEKDNVGLRVANLVCSAALVLQQMEMLAPGKCQVGPGSEYKAKNRGDVFVQLLKAREILQVREPPMRTGQMLIDLKPPLEKRFTFLVHDMKESYCSFDEGDEPNEADNPPAQSWHLPVPARAPVTPAQLCANSVGGVASASPPSAASGAHSRATLPAMWTWHLNRPLTRAGDQSGGESVASAAPAAFAQFATPLVEPVRQQAPNRMDFLDAPAAAIGVLPAEDEIIEIDSDEENFAREPWITMRRPQPINPTTRPPVGFYTHSSISLEVQNAGLKLQNLVLSAALCFGAQNVCSYERLLESHPALSRGMSHFDAAAVRCLLSTPRRDGVFLYSQVKLVVFVGLDKKLSTVHMNDFVFVVTAAGRRTALARARREHSMINFIVGVRRLVAHMLAYKDDDKIPRFAVRFGGGLNDVAEVRE